MSLKRFWKRRALGPEEVTHARKERGSRVKVCEVPSFYYDGYVKLTIARNARHWYGEDIKTITCPSCRERLDMPCL